MGPRLLMALVLATSAAAACWVAHRATTPASRGSGAAALHSTDVSPDRSAARSEQIPTTPSARHSESSGGMLVLEQADMTGPPQGLAAIEPSAPALEAAVADGPPNDDTVYPGPPSGADEGK